jgi:hypothetical protein
MTAEQFEMSISPSTIDALYSKRFEVCQELNKNQPQVDPYRTGKSAVSGVGAKPEFK